jgi:nucleoside-diphosphate-sugar epimerase
MLERSVHDRVKHQIDSKPLVVEGANGSLGLSILHVLKELSVRPSALLLTTRYSEPNPAWYSAAKSVVAVRSTDPDFFDRRACWIRAQSDPVFVLYGAGYGRPNSFLNDPSAVVRANVDQLLGYAEFTNVGHFAYLSSSEVYTGGAGLMFESGPLISTPQHPRGVYIESKRLGESIVTHLINKTAARAASYRVALAMPPIWIDDDSRVLADLLRGGIKDGRVVLNGGADLIRQYQFGPNAIYKLIGSLVNGQATLYNNAGSHVTTLRELAALVASICGAPLIVRDEATDKTSPPSVLLSTELIDRESGYIRKKEKSFEYYVRLLAQGVR